MFHFLEKSFIVLFLGFSTLNILVLSSVVCINGLNTYKLFSLLLEQIFRLFFAIITDLLSKETEYNCSNNLETEIKFRVNPGIKNTLSNNIKLLLQKRNLITPTARADMTSPDPIRIENSPSSSCVQESVHCKEEQTC